MPWDIRSEAAKERMIAVGIAFAALFVLALITIVRIIIAHAT